MKEDVFNELLESISQAGEILRGEREPARTTKYQEVSKEWLLDPNTRELRENLDLTRLQFARLIGVSERTIEGWEQGRRRPKGPALALLRVAALYPDSVLQTMREVSASQHLQVASQ